MLDDENMFSVLISSNIQNRLGERLSGCERKGEERSESEAQYQNRRAFYRGAAHILEAT
jgi:hypothetical protein